MGRVQHKTGWLQLTVVRWECVGEEQQAALRTAVSADCGGLRRGLCRKGERVLAVVYDSGLYFCSGIIIKCVCQ